MCWYAENLLKIKNLGFLNEHIFQEYVTQPVTTYWILNMDEQCIGGYV